VQTDAVTSSSIAALVQAIAAKELDQPTAPGLSREALEESYFQAASHGLEAKIVLDHETPESAKAVCRRMLESVRPYACDLNGDAALDEMERILRRGNGADDQRRIHRETGMIGLLDYLVKRTH
jgi:carboxylate-amine ligase